jgi:putative ABC transport system permease protein
MTSLGYNIRFALRNLRKSPGFAIVVILTLAIGIGANVSIFTLVNAVFFHPLPVRDPERLVTLATQDQRSRAGTNFYLPISHPNAEDIQKRVHSFSQMAMYVGTRVSMSIDGHPESLNAQLVSGNFFDVLGVKAALGRMLPNEDTGGQVNAPVVVLEYGLWARKFGARADVIGRSVLLNGQGCTIVGVAPRGFQGPSILGGPDMWLPMALHDAILTGQQKTYFNERRYLGFFAIGRLQDGTSLQQAQAELRTIGTALETEFPIPNKGRSFALLPLLESSINPNMRDTFVRAGTLMMTVVGLILLIACANIANLLLVRAASRKREISVRVAVGASPRRIITQLLTEAIVVATAGGSVGVLLALAGRTLLWQFRPPFLQQTNMDISFDGRVVLFTVLTVVGTAVIFGLAPALQAARPNLVSELKDRVGETASKGRFFKLRDLFIIAEVALSLIALVGAGLFLTSLHNAQQTDLGFDTHNLAMVSFDPGSLNYDLARNREFQRRVLETMHSTAGIRSAALANAVPLLNGGFSRSVFPEGQEGSSDRNGVLVQIDSISEEYFSTMGIPLTSGSGFDSTVREDSFKVAIINHAASRRFWPNEEPVGKRFKFFGSNVWIQIVGVVRDSKYNTIGEDPTPYIYLPLIQNPSSAVTLFYRTEVASESVSTTVRSEVQALDVNLPLTNMWPIDEVIAQALWGPRFTAGLLIVFAVMALLLCAIGIYGVVGYSVNQRVREIGIRLALGARPHDVLFMVLRQSALILSLGLAIGLASSFLLSRLIVNLLYGANVIMPSAFILTSLLLVAAGLVASYIPARKAAVVDPLIALRDS